MGFYIRKSMSVGPLRFNLSKSGIGVSGGMTGLRLGTGPRGTYIHAGRGGLYYRQYLFTHPRSRRGGASVGAPGMPPGAPPAPTGPSNAVTIASAPANAITDSSAAALLDEIRAKRRLPAFAPFVGVLCLIAVLAALPHGAVAGALAFVLGAAATVACALNDLQRRAVVVMYDLDPDTEAAFRALYDGVMRLRACAAVWSVVSQQATPDYKRNSGASSLLQRQAATIRDGSVPFLTTNISIPSIVLHSDTLYFFPDRIFITNAAGVGAVSYEDIQAHAQLGRFVEDGAVPRDAVQVDQTWRYVNKDGSPDRRFNGNRALPIMGYQEIFFASQTGVRAYLQISDQHGGDAFLQALAALRGLTGKSSIWANAFSKP
ncbi:MAG: DUF4236 domain-containing protein [bacterium]|nr:DUF4236 domain-containing protein [bacterium]